MLRCGVNLLRCGVNLNKNRQKVLKLYSKSLDWRNHGMTDMQRTVYLSKISLAGVRKLCFVVGITELHLAGL